MAIQGSDTGSLENASLEMIIKARHTMEHNAPCLALVRKFTLGKGEDTAVVPKVGQMTFMAVNETEENTNEMDIGMTTTSVSTSIVGGKVVITDFLLKSNTQDIWSIVGKQVGDAATRRIERDIIALFTSLNGGTTLGAAAAIFNIQNVMNVIGYAKTNKFGSDLRIVNHPNSILRLSKDLTTLGSNRPIPDGFSADRLKKFWTGIVLGQVAFFESGNIDLDTNNDAIGAIFNEDAMGILQSAAIRRRKERKESIGEGAWVLYVTHRYTAFEMDDAIGAPLTYASATQATS